MKVASIIELVHGGIHGLVKSLHINEVILQTSFSRSFIVWRLANVDYYGFDRVGAGGAVPFGAQAYAKILASPTAKKDFLHVLKFGTTEAICYALSGLYYLRDNEFDALSRIYKNDQRSVQTSIGGLRTTSSISQILSEFRPAKSVYITVPRGNLVSLQRIEIPEETHKRIQGTYKKAKLKCIWFVSTCFVEGKYFTPENVDSVIGNAMSRLDYPARFTDTCHIRSALCELKFLTRTPDGRKYWKTGQVEEFLEPFQSQDEKKLVMIPANN